MVDMGAPCQNVRTAHKYTLLGQLSASEIALIGQRILSNDCIETCIRGEDGEPPSPHALPYEFARVEWPLRALSAGQLVQMSKERDLFLTQV